MSSLLKLISSSKYKTKTQSYNLNAHAWLTLTAYKSQIYLCTGFKHILFPCKYWQFIIQKTIPLLQYTQKTKGKPKACWVRTKIVFIEIFISRLLYVRSQRVNEFVQTKMYLFRLKHRNILKEKKNHKKHC